MKYDLSPEGTIGDPVPPHVISGILDRDKRPPKTALDPDPRRQIPHQVRRSILPSVCGHIPLPRISVFDDRKDVESFRRKLLAARWFQYSHPNAAGFTAYISQDPSLHGEVHVIDLALLKTVPEDWPDDAPWCPPEMFTFMPETFGRDGLSTTELVIRGHEVLTPVPVSFAVMLVKPSPDPEDDDAPVLHNLLAGDPAPRYPRPDPTRAEPMNWATVQARGYTHALILTETARAKLLEEPPRYPGKVEGG